MSVQIDAATATLLAAAVGGFSSGATAIIILFITKRSEERRHLRELAIRAAIDNWHYVSKAAEEAGQPRLPLDVYMVHMFKLADALSGRLTAESLPRKLREVHQFTTIATSETERFSAEISGEKT